MNTSLYRCYATFFVSSNKAFLLNSSTTILNGDNSTPTYWIIAVMGRLHRTCGPLLHDSTTQPCPVKGRHDSSGRPYGDTQCSRSRKLDLDADSEGDAGVRPAVVSFVDGNHVRCGRRRTIYIRPSETLDRLPEKNFKLDFV